MTLAEHVRTLGRGPGRSRSLTRAEAQDAMTQMLSGQAAPEAIGALLMLLRMKGETADEIAGFAEAAQAAMPGLTNVDLDWPSYAAGRTRGQPWFLLSAKLVARAGFRVLLHGWNGADPKVRAGLTAAGIQTAPDLDTAAQILQRDRVAYLPIETAHPALFQLLQLREVLGLRSCVNTVCRMLNPAKARASVQGVFHPSYRLLQADAAQLMGWQSLSVIKGGGGEFERHPAKRTEAFGLRNGTPWQATFHPLISETRRLADSTGFGLTDLRQNTPTPAFEKSVILGTAALALDTLGQSNALQTAEALWSEHQTRYAA
ncbi:MAG: glycosyl transferase family protein [Paracoccaceae bacterium]|nr:glycosyl transferase family protein [Paracoccaceae bacterium]